MLWRENSDRSISFIVNAGGIDELVRQLALLLDTSLPTSRILVFVKRFDFEFRGSATPLFLSDDDSVWMEFGGNEDNFSQVLDLLRDSPRFEEFGSSG